MQKNYRRTREEVKYWTNYLAKYQKTQCAVFEQNKLIFGSGTIESAIRRFINLRFKNAATFWDKPKWKSSFANHAALLSKR